MLKIRALNINIGKKKILNDVNLLIPDSETHVLMGPNGSGKSTLAKAIMGHPDLVVSGEIIFNKKNIIPLKTYERARLGIYIGFQNPPELEGVNFRNFLRIAYNSRRKKQLSVFDFQDLLLKTASKLKIKQELLDRNINEGLSGGEKKKMEVLQLFILSPKLIILDEIDSGLDIDSLKTIFTSISELKKKNKKLSILLITHYHKVFDILKPDRISIIKNGTIIKTSDISIIKQIEEKGFN